MLFPNLCIVEKQSADLDVYGQPVSRVRSSQRCAIVRFIRKSIKTTVRADSSGSRGYGQESLAEVIFLFPPSANIEIEDRIEFGGRIMRVMESHPRFDVNGKADHLEIGMAEWE